MMLDKEYFDGWMQRLIERLDHIEKCCGQGKNTTVDGEKLIDNSDVCQMLNISKRTLQRYRSLGDLPYQMIYHKTLYKEKDVLAFIARHLSEFRKMKKGGNNSL